MNSVASIFNLQKAMVKSGRKRNEQRMIMNYTEKCLAGISLKHAQQMKTAKSRLALKFCC